MKKYVAIEYADNGTCKRVLEVKSICENEYNKLINQESNNRQNEAKVEEDYEKVINNICVKLHSVAFCTALSIYYDMVDRGVFKVDEKFNELCDDYFLENKEINYNDLPNDFKKIFAKVMKGE